MTLAGAYGFSGRDTGRISAVVRAYESGEFGKGTDPQTPANDANYGKIPFRNDSGVTISAYGIVRVTGKTKIDERNILTVSTVDATYRWLYLVNGPEDVTNGKRGWGTWLWHGGPVLYDTGSTPAYGEQWGPKSGSQLVWQKRPGFFIQGATAGSGSTARVDAMQFPPGQILVYNASGSAIAAAGSGTATLYGGTALSEATLGLTMTVYNRTSVSWADAKYGMADLINGQAYVSPQQT